MKTREALLGGVLIAVGLMACSSTAWGADWRGFADTTAGFFRYDASSISKPSEGAVRVWINNVNRNETTLLEIKCKEGLYQVLSIVTWDENFRMKSREDYFDVPAPNWLKISPKSIPEAVSETVCE